MTQADEVRHRDEGGGMRDEGPKIRKPRGGFVNPEYLIMLALVGIGVALVGPVVYALTQSAAVSTWDWVSLGAGALMIVACVVWYARMK